MKYNDNGEYKDIYIKTFDTLPVGTEVDYDGETVPNGWSEIDNVLYETPTPLTSQNSISFSNISNYEYVEILYGNTLGAQSCSLKLIPSIAIGQNITFNIMTTDTSTGILYLSSSRYNLTATGMSFVRTTQKQLNADGTTTTNTSTTPSNLVIYKVIGYN